VRLEKLCAMKNRQADFAAERRRPARRGAPSTGCSAGSVVSPDVRSSTSFKPATSLPPVRKPA
jgi:hypothetical protein